MKSQGKRKEQEAPSFPTHLALVPGPNQVRANPGQVLANPVI